MTDIDKKLNEIEKKILENREYEKKQDQKYKEEQKISLKNLSLFWDEQFKKNKEFIKNLEKIKKRFKKLNPDSEYIYEISKGDEHEIMFTVKFRFNSINLEVELCTICIAGDTNPKIQFYFNEDPLYENPSTYTDSRKHLKNFKFNEIDKAKNQFFDKILEIFQLHNKGKFE